MRRTLAALVLSALAAGASFAQPNMGDIVVTSHTGDYVGVIDRNTGVLTTLSTLPGDPIPVIMASNNRDVLAFERPSPGNVWSIDPNGVLTPVGNATAGGEGSVVGADWTQDGNILICASAFGSRGWLRNLNLTTNSYTTLFTAPVSHFRHASWNTDNGNVLVCRWATGGDLLEVDINAQTISTVVSGFSSNSAVDPDPGTGNYVFSNEASFSAGVNVVTPAGAVVQTMTLPVARAVKVDDAAGTYIAPTGNTGSMASRVVEFDRAGNVVRTYGPFGNDGFAGVEIYGSHQVHGFGSALPGTSYSVSFSFPGFGGSGYVGALSLAQRPGLTVPGGTVHLALDSLFLASLQGLFVSNFQGTLDVRGQATGTINLPAFLPSGVRFFCSGVAVGGAGLVTGNTIGVTIQ